MSDFFLLRPSVYGQLGPRTVLDRSAHPPLVSRLHYVLDILPNDDLHSVFPCHLVSGRLAKRLEAGKYSGATLADLDAEMDPQLTRQHPKASLPDMRWLQVHGVVNRDDFAVNAEGLLAVSAGVMQVLRTLQLSGCIVYNADRPPTAEQITDDIWEEARRVAAATRKAKKPRGHG